MSKDNHICGPNSDCDMDCMRDADYADVGDGYEEMGFCCFPNCVMNYQPHFPSECYSPEMYDDMVAEAESPAQTTTPHET